MKSHLVYPHWLSGSGGLDDHEGLFQSQWLYDSVTAPREDHCCSLGHQAVFSLPELSIALLLPKNLCLVFDSSPS